MGTQKQSGCSCTEKRPYEDTARRHHLWARERHLRGNQTCWHLDIGRLASRAGRKLFLLFRPSSQWYSIVAALANYYTGLKSLALRRRKDQSSMRSRFKLLPLLKHKLGLSKSLLINQKKQKTKKKKQTQRLAFNHKYSGNQFMNSILILGKCSKWIAHYHTLDWTILCKSVAGFSSISS